MFVQAAMKKKRQCSLLLWKLHCRLSVWNVFPLNKSGGWLCGLLDTEFSLYGCRDILADSLVDDYAGG